MEHRFVLKHKNKYSHRKEMQEHYLREQKYKK